MRAKNGQQYRIAETLTRGRVSDAILFGSLSVFGFTFIHLLTTAERKNCAVEGSQRINLSAEKPMNRAFAERLKLLKEK